MKSIALTLAALSISSVVFATDNSDLQSGLFETSFHQYAESATYVEVITRMIGSEEGRKIAAVFNDPENSHLSKHSVDLKVETFSVYVPSSCIEQVKCGVLVYIPAKDDAAPPKAYLPGLNTQNLIYVSAHNSGNEHSPIERRLPLALHGLENIVSQYDINSDRIYVAGFSGGGKVAGYLGVGFGDIFKGALYICGSLPIGKKSVKLPNGEVRKTVLTQNQYVFLTGKRDFNRKKVKQDARNYRKSGIKNVNIIDSSLLGHEEPRAALFMKALNQLDSVTVR